ncbi:MAG: hypothetical protein IT452_00110 [Planctomycetia bacterium]|nr:hypothetical protein [Planctomycetia bacterium]
MRLSPLAVALAVLLSPLLAFADRIFLKDGRVIEGEILSQTDKEVKISIGKHGAALTFDLKQVEKIDRTAASPEQLYDGRLLLCDRKNPDALVTLADWCAKNGLTEKAALHYVEALGLLPDHARARGRLTEMGYREVDGKWLSPKELEKLANPPVEPVKPPEPKVPTSEDVAKAQGPSVAAVWAKDAPGVGAWATEDGLIWVCGRAAQGSQQLEVDFEGRKWQARPVARDRVRGVALWKVDGVHAKPVRPFYGALPERDPLVALTPEGVMGNVFARGWERVSAEVWVVKIEGVQGAAAVFDLKGELLGLSGDGKTAVGAIDLARLRRMGAPAPEGEQNAAGSFWRACDLAEGPALEMIRTGSRLDSFDPGLGADDIDRAQSLARDLARLGKTLKGDVDDAVAALRLARHLARAGRVSFSLAAAEILEAQTKTIAEGLPRLSPAQLQRLRATVEGLGPDPAGLESAATGEVKRLESITQGAKEAKSLLDLQISGFPILGPEPVESLEGGVAAMYDVVHEAQEFAMKVRAACSRPDEARRTDLDALPAGPGPFRDFATLRARAFGAMTARTALRIAIRLREIRADSGSYPSEVPSGLEDPATGRPFEVHLESRGFRLVAPSGAEFRVRE